MRQMYKTCFGCHDDWLRQAEALEREHTPLSFFPPDGSNKFDLKFAIDLVSLLFELSLVSYSILGLTRRLRFSSAKILSINKAMIWKTKAKRSLDCVPAEQPLDTLFCATEMCRCCMTLLSVIYKFHVSHLSISLSYFHWNLTKFFNKSYKNCHFVD